MKISEKKGFTLIELLVVIAIIGILASIVLVSLSGAKNRAKDGRIIADLNQIRTTAEISNQNVGDFSKVLTSGGDADIAALYTDVVNQGGTMTIYLPTPPALPTAYCAEAKLNSNNYFCVDNNLNAIQNGTTASCSSSDLVCNKL